MPIIRPKNPMQKAALQSTCDYVVLAGSVKGGKTFAASWLPAYRIKNKIGKSTSYLRVNDRNFKDPGGFFDKFEEIYGLKVHNEKDNSKDDKRVRKVSLGTLTKTMPAVARFINGYECHFKAVYRFDKQTLESLFKGNETDVYVFDECEDFTWYVVNYAQTRLRGKADVPRQIVLLQNPERECFVRRICGSGATGGGWIKDDGYVDQEMNGKVRYFFNPKGDESRFFWGDSPEEVYIKCQDELDSMLEKFPTMDWRDAIMSMVFLDLPIIDDDNKYIGRLLGSSAFDSVADVNWNYSKYDADESEGKRKELRAQEISAAFKKPSLEIFTKVFMTVDVAGTTENDDEVSEAKKASRRSDNMTCFCWGLNQYGLHCLDIQSWKRPHISTVKQNIRDFRDKHRLRDSQIVIDLQGIGALLIDDFPTARRSNTANKISNRGTELYANYKSENVGVTCTAIQEGVITFAPHLAHQEYEHSRIAKGTTILHQMMFECRGLEFNILKNGKKEIIPKKEMIKYLKGFSPDLFDPVFMAVGAHIYDVYRLLSDRGAPNLTVTQDTNNPIYADQNVKTYGSPQSTITKFTNKLNARLRW